MKDFLNIIARILLILSAIFNVVGFFWFINEYIFNGHLTFTDIVIRHLHIGSFFFVLYLIVCLIRSYLIKKNLI